MSNPHTIYFVEDDDPELDYATNPVVSLTPEASYDLGRRRIRYRIPEEFYCERDLTDLQPSFFRTQLQWIKTFDGFLRKQIRFCSENEINLASLFYNRLKYFVDSVIIQTHMLNGMLKDVVGSSGDLVYVRRRERAKRVRTMDAFRNDKTSALFGDLLPCFSGRYPDLMFRLHEHGTEERPYRNGVSRETNFRWLKHVGRHLPLLSQVYRMMKYSSYPILRKTKDGLPAKRFLVIHSGSRHLNPLIMDLVEQGAVVFLREESEIFDLTAVSKKGIYDLEERVDEDRRIQIERECLVASDRLSEEARGLLQWIDDQCGIPVRQFVLPYLREFIKRACPEVLRLASNLTAFINDSAIDYVVSHTSSDLISKSALVAAKLSKQAKTVCVQHGCQGFEDPMWEKTDIDLFDYYFCTDQLSQDRFRRSILKDYVSPAVILQYPQYLSRIRSKFRRENRFIPKQNKRILYLPNKSAVHARHFNCLAYPVQWYIEFQKALLRFFSERKDATFIYKYPSSAKQYLDKTALCWIEDEKYQNIVVESEMPMDYFDSVDGVILDRPTTALFETAVSGLPVLNLYPDFFAPMVSSEIAQHFGKTLQGFTTFQEAFEKINVFLDSGGSEYVCDIPLRDDGCVQTLFSGTSEGSSERIIVARQAVSQ